MEESVGAAETNCESDKHIKCSKCSTTSDKHVPQPAISEKHKQKNQEILERKIKLANAGRRISQKISEPESHLLTKLAFERQQQKKVEVSDSHAIDFTTQSKETDDHSDLFLPRHLKKRQSSQLLNLNKVKVENNTDKRQTLQTAVDDSENENENRAEGENVLEVLRNVEDLRKASLAYRILEPQRNSPYHDTLQVYFKFRKENMVKEDRLRKVQAKARLRKEDQALNLPSVIRKPVGPRSNLLPPLRKLNSETKLGTKKNATELKVVHYKERANRERHGKLPKLSPKISKVRDGNTGRDPRFQKLVSCLVPLTEKTAMSPPFTRKKYTM